VDEDMADTIVEKAKGFLKKHKDETFFLYFSTHDIHVPRVPNPRFVGKTPMGPRGDVIAQFDWCVGEILDTLEGLGLEEKTMVIFTSDNGPVVDDGYKDQSVELLGDHKPSGPLRGGKYSAFDAGTRVPFVVRWPGRIKPGVSEALACQIDFPASFASLTGQRLAHGDAPDSFNILEAMLGRTQKGRDHLVEHARTLSLVKGQWKYIQPNKGSKVNKNTNTELGLDQQPQLYNLKADIAEQHNLAAEHPEIVKELSGMLEKIKAASRSR